MLEVAERANADQSSIFKWSLAICANEVERAVQHYVNALRQHEYLAYVWSQGNAGMRRLFPAFYTSPKRDAALRAFGLDARSIARLSVPELTG